MKLVIRKEPFKILSRLQPRVAAAIRAELANVTEDPFAKHRNVERLAGTDNGFRLRHGDWRILYAVDRRSQTVFVDAVKPRGEAYKR